MALREQRFVYLLLPGCQLHACTHHGTQWVHRSTTPVVFAGPSGVGKGTLIELLRKTLYPTMFSFSVSHTMRKPQEGEQDGVHYHFTDVEKIKKEISVGGFI
ncbi:hypothetical protein ACHAW5_007439 [Stephanodiscus triporus]|uniref:Guanylate kinase-like domain-containing protein n=1 Tax=Stephanodiscus triporus TaxID=2934178 RepID=A0ABD3NBR7_9STRA